MLLATFRISDNVSVILAIKILEREQIAALLALIRLEHEMIKQNMGHICETWWKLKTSHKVAQDDGPSALLYVAFESAQSRFRLRAYSCRCYCVFCLEAASSFVLRSHPWPFDARELFGPAVLSVWNRAWKPLFPTGTANLLLRTVRQVLYIDSIGCIRDTDTNCAKRRATGIGC